MIIEHLIMCPYCKGFFKYNEGDVLSLFIFCILYCKNCGSPITYMNNMIIF
jgi:uncharacterized protein YbaR (Trm112 family)